MPETATTEDKRFVWVNDIDNKEAPIFVGSIVSVILSGNVPGFAALNESEFSFIDEILRDAEHHHRFLMLHAPNAVEVFQIEAHIERKVRKLRVRLGLPLHYEKSECCPYLSNQHENREGVGL